MKLESGLNAYFTRVLKQSEEKGGGNMTTAPRPLSKIFHRAARTRDNCGSLNGLRSLTVALGRECYPGGNCVASELGKEQTVGQIKVPFVFLFRRYQCVMDCNSSGLCSCLKNMANKTAITSA